MTYLQYIFSDKKAAIYWISILVIILIIPFLISVSFAINGEIEIWGLVNVFRYFIIYIIIYIGFYTSGYLNYKLQGRFENYYASIIENKAIYWVEIYQEKFTIKPYRVNYDAKIEVRPRMDSFNICKINQSLVILGFVYDYGIFKRHMRPIQIDLDKSGGQELRFVSKSKIRVLEYLDSDLVIKFKKSINSINKLIIKDYNENEVAN